MPITGPRTGRGTNPTRTGRNLDFGKELDPRRCPVTAQDPSKPQAPSKPARGAIGQAGRSSRQLRPPTTRAARSRLSGVGVGVGVGPGPAAGRAGAGGRGRRAQAQAQLRT
jgi:hypothetical protein